MARANVKNFLWGALFWALFCRITEKRLGCGAKPRKKVRAPDLLFPQSGQWPIDADIASPSVFSPYLLNALDNGRVRIVELRVERVGMKVREVVL